MPIRHTVVRGECIGSIAFAHGHAPSTLWDDPANEALRGAREHPNMLVEGDVVVVADKRIDSRAAGTGRRHVFRRRGVPEVYRAQFLTRAGAARAGVPYRFRVLDAERRGETDADGRITEWIPPDCMRVEILLGDPPRERYIAVLGALEPVTTVRGVRARLHHLGFGGDATEGDALPAAALRRFQEQHDLEVTGELDDATRDKLASVFGA